MSTNLYQPLANAAAARPDSPALLLGDEVITYAQLQDSSERVAAALQSHGVKTGDAIGLMVPNVPEFAIVYYGALRAGVAVVPMNPLLKSREVEYYLSDSGAKRLFAWHQFAAEANAGGDAAGVTVEVVEPGAYSSGAAEAAVATRAADDTAVILYTSGTTGRPKGAELTHGNLLRNAEVTDRTLLELGASDVILGALPLFHAFGQTCGLNAAVHSGSALALIPRFNAALVLETIDTHSVTVFEGVPTMYAALLHEPARVSADTSSLRVCISGGAALPVEILRGFEETFGCTILEGYGLSETSPVACFNHPDRERLPGSIGTPIEGVEMRIVDPDRRPVGNGESGEVAIRGHNIMKGYLGRPEATAEAIDADGWFYSGDIGRIDEQGRYFIVDRKKELIIRGGFNIYPREIEEVLYEHPAVREVAVIGVAHAELGEEVGAAVSLKASAKVSPSELRDYVKARVAAYKYPRLVWFLDELPKGPTGKILKREIKPPTDDAPKGGGGQ